VKKGALITFEGIEGSGKSSHARDLAQFLEERGIPALLTFEPGATDLGKALRDILLSPNGVRDPWVELFLFLADRREHVTKVILPALEMGTWVLCDRYIDSTLAYQGYGRGLPLSFLREANEKATGRVMPDLTLLLDCPIREGLRRAKGDDRLQRESLEFHERVRRGYIEIARREPSRVVVIDSSRAKEEVQREIREKVEDFLRRWRQRG